MVTATVNTFIGADMHNLAEVTSSVIASTTSCAILDNMINSLNYYSDAQGGLTTSITPETAWYVEEGFWAHEELHGQKFEDSLDTAFPGLKFGFENITIPIDSAANTTQAYNQLIGTTEFAFAELALFDAQAFARDAADHPPWEDFNAVQHAVSDPWVSAVQSRKVALSCP